MPWRGTALQARFLMAKNAFRWLDDTVNFTKRAAFRNIVDDLIVDSDGRLDPQDMIAKMAEVGNADNRKRFRSKGGIPCVGFI